MAILTGALVSQNDATAQHALGEIYTTGSKTYKYITYAAASAATAGVAGEVCYYLAATGYANSDVTSDLSDSDEVGAGVLQTAMADNTFGWIQIKGLATLTIALTAGADGDPLTPTGSADGTLDVSADVTDVVCATAGDISAKIILCDFPQ